MNKLRAWKGFETVMKEFSCNFKKNVSALSFDTKITIIFVVLVLALCFSYALRFYPFISISAINGDFQNYNVVRRFLVGQAPFRDFVAYLGFGHLILLSIPQLVFGDNFAMSIAISHAVTFLSFAFLIYVLSQLIIKDKTKSIILTISFLLLNLLRPDFFTSIFSDSMLRSFDFGLTPSNSARLIRAVIIPIILFTIPLLLKKLKFDFCHFDFRKESLVACVSFFAIIWSNDAGIMLFLVFSLFYAILHWKCKGFCIMFFKSAGTYLVMGVTSLILTLTLITRGSPLSWFRQTIGVSDYQHWYFEWLRPSSLLSLSFDFYTVIHIGFLIYYTSKFLNSKKSNSELMAYCWLSIFISAFFLQAFIYNIFSGSFNHDALRITTVVLVAAHLYKRVNFKNLKVASIFFLLFIMLIFRDSMLTRENFELEGAPVLIPELGGIITRPSGELLKYASERVGDQNIFSTYAGAIEIMTNQFQPSGVDYIIHVLGDEARKNYMDVFREGDFTFVTTISPNTGSLHFNWGNWIIQANWFFHRELFANYSPIFTTDYQIFWKQATEENNLLLSDYDYYLSKTRVSPNEYLITFMTDDKSLQGTIDISVTYSVLMDRFLRNFDYNLSAIWTDRLNQFHRNSFGLRPSSYVTTNAPITVINGHGEALITSSPRDNSRIIVHEMDVVKFLGHPFNFAYASRNKRGLWMNGISSEDYHMISVDNVYPFNKAMTNARGFKIDGHFFEIIMLKECEDYFLITLNREAYLLAWPNIFKVISY